MKYLFLTLMLTFSTFSFADCPMKFPSKSLCGELNWIKGPLLNVKSHFQFKFWKDGDAEKTPVSPNATVKIYSWMTMANGHYHGGPSMTSRETSTGVFEVNDARFFMHGMRGYWEVVIDLINDGIKTDSARYKVQF